MGRGSNLALTPSRFRNFLPHVGVKLGNASLDPNSFSTASGHKHTRGYPGSMQTLPSDSCRAAMSSHSPPAPRSASAAAVVDFPATASPAIATAAAPLLTALA